MTQLAPPSYEHSHGFRNNAGRVGTVEWHLLALYFSGGLWSRLFIQNYIINLYYFKGTHDLPRCMVWLTVVGIVTSIKCCNFNYDLVENSRKWCLEPVVFSLLQWDLPLPALSLSRRRCLPPPPTPVSALLPGTKKEGVSPTVSTSEAAATTGRSLGLPNTCTHHCLRRPLSR